MMNTYQLSGLSGTGKSTIQAELIKLGFDTIDTDKEWGYYGNLKTEEPVALPPNAPREWFEQNGFIWNSKTIRPFLMQARQKPLFICGGSRNDENFYDLFTNVFVLHVPDNVLRQRLQDRTGDQTATDLYIDRMVEFNQDTYERAEKFGGIVIETTEPIDVCMQKILGFIHDN